EEAAEVAWLLGAPFLLQVIEGWRDDLVHVLGGPVETSKEGERLLNARWRVTVPQPVDTGIAGVSGDPARHEFAEVARALPCALRVVKPGGRIVLLSRAKPALGQGGELLRQAENPGQGLSLLRQHEPPDMAAAFQWANAVQQVAVYLLSDLAAETAE